MSIRTLCVADDATREILRHLVAQMPQCEVVAWLHPSEAQVAVAAMKPDIILVAPELTATMHEPMQPYSRSMLPTALPLGQEPSFLKQGVVALPMVDGIELFACESIVQVKGEGSYVRFVFTYRNELVLAKTLADCIPIVVVAIVASVAQVHHVPTNVLLLCLGQRFYIDVSWG